MGVEWKSSEVEGFGSNGRIDVELSLDCVQGMEILRR